MRLGEGGLWRVNVGGGVKRRAVITGVDEVAAGESGAKTQLRVNKLKNYERGAGGVPGAYLLY